MHLDTSLTSIDWWLCALNEYLIHPSIMIILCLLSVFVVLGNSLVVSAIWHETQLHSATNYLIASLAAADCLVGLVVMPFSIISETIIGSWTFGPTWCDLWHSFDVLASTASILNLCAISFDRYLAITDPIKYPKKMNNKRVALIVISLWTCSSLISFPAIIWWRAVGEPLQLLPPQTPPISYLESKNETTISSLGLSSESLFRSVPNQEVDSETAIYKCVFTDDTYYLLFSSIISFYGPAGIMLYAYYRIYKAAVEQTRFLKHGSKQVVIGKNKRSKRNKHSSENSNYGASERSALADVSCDRASTNDAYDKQHLVLRAHRGGGKSTSNSTMANNNGEQADSANKCSPDNHREKHDSEHRQNCLKEPRNFTTVSLSKSSLKSVSSKNESIGPSNKSTISNRNQFERSSFVNNRKDKLKIYSQRFDYNPLEHEDQIKQESPSKDDRISIACKTNDVEKNGRSEIMEQSKRDQVGVKRPSGKPLLASISCQSTGVDVSVINHYSAQIASLSPNCESTFNAMVTLNGSMMSNNKKTNSSFMITNKAAELSEKENSSLKRISNQSDSDEDQGTDDDSSTSGGASSSSSDSSETYGTGSIASVLMRPRSSQKNSFENNLGARDCFYSKAHQSNDARTMRRTLSVGEPRAFELRQMQSEMANPKLGKITGTKVGLHRPIGGVHRSSCGNTNLSQDSNDPPTSTANRVSNFRSWVRFKSNKRGSSDLTSKQENSIRAPRSLLPLMIMNSDTSTDSSIAASLSKHGEDSREFDRAKPSGELMMSSIGRKSPFSGQLGEIQSMVVETHPKRNNLMNVQQPRSENDLDGKNGTNKGQILYYDSDRLIQSLVDLTAIHYIDCANQPDKSPQPKVVEDIEAFDKQRITIELSEQVQVYGPNRISIPRQQRTVGKKLSKLAKERKAAKTLGIVVGVFILCWLPFFVVNIVVALCGTNCIYKFEVFVAIVTWLGWLNSAMNPVIYACWSRDFRRAFKRVLCSWIEFICPYDGGNLAKKLRLKKASRFPKKEYLARNVSSVRGPTSSTVRSGVSMNGSISRSLISDQ